MARKKHKKSDKKKNGFTAKTADKHMLYQQSVQDTGSDIRFVRRIFKKQRGRVPTILREDFCGTALLCADWVKGKPENRAIGVDLHTPTLKWAKKHNLAPLGKESERVSLLNQNVLDDVSQKADIVLALNFSYCVFKQRQDLKKYFSTVKRGLKEDGVFVLDIHGGMETTAEIVEKTKHKGFTYVWEQAPFDAINGLGKRYIHFSFPDGTKIKRAFTYDWRLWNLPEMRDALLESGYSNVEVYWEGADEDGDGNGIFRSAKKAEEEESWIAYVVAWR